MDYYLKLKTITRLCVNECYGFIYYTISSTHDARGVFSVCRLTIRGHEHMPFISRAAPRITLPACLQIRTRAERSSTARQNKSSGLLEEIVTEIYYYYTG